MIIGGFALNDDIESLSNISPNIIISTAGRL